MKYLKALSSLLMLTAAPAWAGLEICNATDARHSVAIGYKGDEGWTSEGWWNIDPGDCVRPLKDDLRYQYYCFRATSGGHEFQDENYVFCTQKTAFTIVGDEDCADRGYTRSKFRRIDTGEGSLDYSFTFDASVSLAAAPKAEPERAPAPDPAPAAAPEGDPPGTWGEPYFSSTAVFQGCIHETEAPFCTFHADGYKMFVNMDGRTRERVFALFERIAPGTPIEVDGDLAGIYDRTADVVLRSALPREWNRWDGILDRLQGTWYSVSDPNSQFNIIGSELENIYDGAYGGVEYLNLSSFCDGYEGGEYFVRTDEESGDQLCYSIEELEDFRMLLMYVPRANSTNTGSWIECAFRAQA